MSLADDLMRLEQLRDRGSLTPDEFTRAKDRLLYGQPAPRAQANLTGLNGFRRSISDRWFAGLCGGLGVATGVDAWIWRVLFVLLLCVAGTGVFMYLLLWILVPQEPASTPLQISR